VTQQKVIPVRFIFRSHPMIELLTIMERTGLWKKCGIEVTEFRYSNDPIAAEEELFAGKIDLIFGNHVSPYWRLAQGHPMVCLAQAVNYDHQWVATSLQVTSLPQLQGKRVVTRPLFLRDGGFSGHSYGNRILLLELSGVNTKELDYVDPGTVEDEVEAVRDGKADGCFISPHTAQAARAAGLRVHELSPLPMIHNLTFTTFLPRVRPPSSSAPAARRPWSF
jgi:ABC-type nitrate/sulfonate/bicarbonate transport system substrate-binding protein